MHTIVAYFILGLKYVIVVIWTILTKCVSFNKMENKAVSFVLDVSHIS